jgi:hypothetical protein
MKETIKKVPMLATFVTTIMAAVAFAFSIAMPGNVMFRGMAYESALMVVVNFVIDWRRYP